MSTLLFVAGLAFLVSGLLSYFKISEVGMTYVSMTQIHTLPFLTAFAAVWVYIVLGVLLIAIAGAFSRRK